MRHAILLCLFTLCMALITNAAYRFDLSREHLQQQAMVDQINQDLLRLERQYLNLARPMLSARNAQNELLAVIDSTQASLANIQEPLARDAEFQPLTSRIRASLLQAPPTDDATLQEWRRAQDQMNGILHRRELLLKRLQAGD